MWVPARFLYDTRQAALEAHPDETLIKVTACSQQSDDWTDDEIDAVSKTLTFINGLGKKRFSFKATSQGCRLIRSAYHDALSEHDGNKEKARTMLNQAVAFCSRHWLNDLKMSRYYRPENIFRKGKWRERAQAQANQMSLIGEDW